MKQTGKGSTKIEEKAKANKGGGTKGKTKNNEPEEEETQGPPPEKTKNLERFIYVTTYSDSQFMQTLKQVFEEVNQPAFKLRSVKEIYTRGLSEEERDNNEIDYISGFQIIDKSLRITILEGITGMGMKKVKEMLPKTKMNTKSFMVFADSNVLFNKRIYSKFDLSLKYIKLRDNLSNILQTYDIYTKAAKYKQIFDSFLSFGSILKAETMKEIALANLFPDSDSLLLLERKYADILNDEDMTGVHKEKKKRKKIKIDNFNKTSLSGLTGKSSSGKSKGSRSDSFDDSSGGYSSDEKKSHSSRYGSSKKENKSSKINEQPERGVSAKPELKKILVDARNPIFENSLKERLEKKVTLRETYERNKNYIHTMNKKPSTGKFCRPNSDYDNFNKEIIYGYSKSNHYDEITKKMREGYLKDKNHLYTYSSYGLNLNFPMIERDRNEKYLNYIKNKEKWIEPNKDFERYKQPTREKYYFPKINNVL